MRKAVGYGLGCAAATTGVLLMTMKDSLVIVLLGALIFTTGICLVAETAGAHRE